MRGGQASEVTVIKRLVCLANSRKLQGRCIAGRELRGGKPGAWIRPVSDREHEEVSEYERQYEDGSDPRVLDIIEIPLLVAKPKSRQPENWLLDPEKYWHKVGEFNYDQLSALTDGPGPIWTNGHSSNIGLNDYLPIKEADRTDSSLKLISVGGLRLHIHRPGENFGNPKRKIRADFSFSGMNYSLSVTDPSIEAAYLAKADGFYTLGPRYLTISLGEPFDGNCYKLVAAIIGAHS